MLGQRGEGPERQPFRGLSMVWRDADELLR